MTTAHHPKNNSVHLVEVPRAALEALRSKFPEGVNVFLAAPEDLASSWVRLPKAGQVCSVTGLPRSSLIDLLKRAGKAVTVRTIRRPKATTGITLIHRASLNAYLEGLDPPDWQGIEDEEETNQKEDES